MSNTRPHKRQKTSHNFENMMILTTLSIMSQYHDDESRPTKKRKTNHHMQYTHSYEEMFVSEILLGMHKI